MLNQDLGLVFELDGSNVTTDYAFSPSLALGRAKRVRFFIKCVRAADSSATTTTFKLQGRDPGVTDYVDVPSNRDDTMGTASTLEVGHAYSTPAGASSSFSFYLDNARCLNDVVVGIVANAAGADDGDTTSVYAVAEG